VRRAQRALHNARRRERRVTGKVADLISNLKAQRLLTSDAEELVSNFKSIPISLFRTRKHGAYSEEQKQFASTLFYYSPSAYAFASRHLPLPDRRTIQGWLSNNDALPGFTEQSFAVLAEKCKSDKQWQYKVCALCVDEMEIRKQVEIDKSTGAVCGFVNIGRGELNDDKLPQATKALVILAVGLCGSWKVPLGYWFTDGCSGTLLSSLLLCALEKLHEVGCVALSITADGAPANLKAFETLGCCFEPDKLLTTFPHPSQPELHVAAILDPVHMIKLVRNLFFEYKLVTIPGVGTAKWHHVDQLDKLQESEGLSLANRLTRRHVDFSTQKMKVKLAVQVLSDSVAKAMTFLRQEGHERFLDSQPTEVFIQRFDKLFDVMNSRSPHAAGYKKPISSTTFASTCEWLQDTKSWLLQLEDASGKRLVHTRRKTGIIGLCVAIDSVIHLCKQLLCSEVNGVSLKYLLTYKLCQDHVELLFGLIRRRGGNNNNPTSQMFRWAYRAVLTHVGVVASAAANITPLDSTELLVARNETVGFTEADLFSADVFVSEEQVLSLPMLSSLSENVCCYISGFIVRKLTSRLKCATCRELLLSSTVLPDSRAFLELKNNGGLVVPSQGVNAVVKHAEKCVRMVVHTCDATRLKQFGHQLEVDVLSAVDPYALFGFEHAMETFDGVDNHVISLTRLIVRSYVNLRKNKIAKLWNLTRTSTNIRHKLTKLILFKNQ
jgi:hypothetical protein